MFVFVCIISIEVGIWIKYVYREKMFQKVVSHNDKKNLAKFAFLSCLQFHIEHLVEIIFTEA